MVGFPRDRLSRLALGTAQLGMDYGVVAPSRAPDEGAARAILDAAWDAGITCFDTARLYGDAVAYRRFTLMFQKEVAVRLAATPGGRDFGRLSVLAQWLCAVRLLFDVPARAFTPPPKVTSAVIELAPRAAPLAPARRERLEQVTAAAFGQRRKMLRASLKQLGRDTPALLDAAGILGTVRAETLSVDQFCALARALDETE